MSTGTYTYRAYRVGLTTRADILKDGEYEMSIVNMFTIRGVSREAELTIADLESGQAVGDVIRTSEEMKRGWGSP